MSMPNQYFRAGAGAVIVNHQGLVLAAERADVAGAWQLPQGGLEHGEGPLQAIVREIGEETHIQESNLELIDSYPTPLVYELPKDMRNEKTGRGQVQYWFLFAYRGDDDQIDLGAAAEFSSWRWVHFGELLDVVIGFRRPVYLALRERFGSRLG